MTKDIRNLTLTGIDDVGAKQYEDAVQALYDYRPGIGNYLQPINEAYPEFIMGRVLLAYSAASEGRYSALHNVANLTKSLNVLYPTATKREQKHIDAVNAWVKADLKGAVEIWDAILSEWPHDLVAFRQMTMNLFWMGQRRRLADLCAKLMPFWDESTPQYNFFIGPVGFVMEELGQYELAEKFARYAAEKNPSDMWAVHAVAHVLEMQGRNAEGIAWIEPKSHVFHKHNAFVGHLWWHLSLFHLESGNIDRVLELFDTQIYPGNSDFYLDIQNGASLLSRLSFLGVDIGDRWSKLLDAVESAKLDYLYDFTDVHSAIVLAQNGRTESLDALNKGLSKRYPHQIMNPG
ncbi:tetratricopeptide repeat protein 38 family protein [Veronia nyctiphanis]|uniref:Tetratricopeptide repeat protein 38 n=1 Tax=Veronia nyctiphanis TaxID=1278244 RepID=A0A4Q0YZ34_9GAMM|nr:tetratricopeptide repeat protein [Veronia nyctiphanis]RXJ74381.1 tetratricopeptide repeat protein 38 family protein [Veronia nyctiphanis]